MSELQVKAGEIANRPTLDMPHFGKSKKRLNTMVEPFGG